VPRPRRILLLASAQSYRNRAFSRAAEALGVEVVTGQDVPLPLLRESERGLRLDYRDLVRSTEAICRFAEKRPLGAVLGVDDSGTLLAARSAAALGLPHNAPDAAAAAADKAEMRRRFAAAGVASPRFRVWAASADPGRVAAAARFPCVIKPTGLSGSRGVMRADDPGQLVERFGRLRRLLERERCDAVIVEDYLPGVEVAVEGLLDSGRLHGLALFDKPDPLEGPFFEETLYVTPSRLPGPAQDALLEAAAAAAAALGLREGPVHAELRWDGERAWLIEVAGRSIGGLCSRTLRFGGGSSLEELVIRQALGLLEAAPERERRAGGVLMIPIPGAGLLRGVEGVEAARAVPGIEDVEITARLHYPLVPLPEGDGYLGFVFARGETPDQVEAALRQAHARLRFRIAPELAVAP
jgi:biotin carboxylase